MAPKRIAILGGGVAALTAAYELTRAPELRARHEVTVYQMGWRLGGKGATGRNLEPGKGLRIEEHGLHIWLGFYDNAFALIQDAYAEMAREGLAPNSPFKSWRDAFKPQSFTPVGVGDGATWLPFEWPTNNATPGAEGPPDTAAAIALALRILLNAVRATFGRNPLRWLCILWRMTRIEAASMRMAGVAGVARTPHLQEIHRHLNRLAVQFREIGDKPGNDGEIARLVLDLLEIGLACVAGFLNPAYGLLEDFDLNRIDGYEFLAWLIENGAPARIGALRVSDNLAAPRQPFLRALYDLAFAYRQTDHGGVQKMTADFAAGAALRCCIRICAGYKGAVLYEMAAGMGEVVASPLYLVLRQRGVRFEFFSKVTGLHLSETGNWIERIRIQQQAAASSGAYEPVFDVKGLPCWPSEPFWDQLKDGALLREAQVNFESHWCVTPQGYDMPTRELRLGEDFDQVVLGLSVGAFKDFGKGEGSPCAELMAASPPFRAMTEAIGIVPTHAEQLWMKPTLAGLGWTDGRPAMVGAVEPLDVWADMSRSLACEDWPQGDAPLSLHYFCGPLNTDDYTRPASDADVPAKALAEVHRCTRHWLETCTGTIWPDAVVPGTGGVDWTKLYGGAGAGAERLGWQFLRANIDPTECCPATWSGTTKFRLHADGSGFLNLTLVGDWTRTGTNTACVESAVMSGMAASRAICGYPRYIPGEHFMQSEA